MSVLIKELLSGSHGAGHFMWTDMLRSHDQTNTDAAFKQILVFLFFKTCIKLEKVIQK